jgi:hypothetical protein
MDSVSLEEDFAPRIMISSAHHFKGDDHVPHSKEVKARLHSTLPAPTIGSIIR